MRTLVLTIRWKRVEGEFGGRGLTAHQSLWGEMHSLSRRATTGQITRLLERWRQGDRSACEELSLLAYPELLGLARAQLRKEIYRNAMTPAELVHEACVRLLPGHSPQCEDRRHFFGAAVHVMRQVLIDQARRRRAAKRGLGRLPEKLTFEAAYETPVLPLLALQQALEQLRALDTRKAHLVELRLFADLNSEEIAALSDLSVATVRRELRVATAWLRRAASLRP